MIKKGSGRTKSGVALLFVISILGLLVLIGISFAINMLLMRKEANNYLNSVKARYIAEAGITKAIMDIRGQVASSSYNDLKTYINGYVAASGTNVVFGGGKYTLTIVSEEGKVNINTFDPETDTSQLTILRNFTVPLTDQQIANIVDYRDTDTANTVIGGSTGNIEGTAPCKNKPFDTIDEIMIATGISKATLDAGTFPNRNRDKITVTKPIIRGGLLGKYYSSITGASPNVAIDKSSFSKQVVELGPVYQTPNDSILPHADSYGDGGWAETHDAEFAGSSSVAPAGDFGIETFGVIWDGYLDIHFGEEGSAITFSVTVDDGARLFIDGTSILPAGSWQDQGPTTYTGTYTFQTPGWHKIRLEYYDNTYGNTVHLKWDVGGPLVVIPADRLGYDPPTEVVGGYNSAGIYTITSTASVVESGATVATKQITAVAEIFGTWTQTTREEFYAAFFGDNAQEAGGVDFSDGEVFNVNWLDSCPTDEDYWDAGASKMHWEGSYTKTLDSVKLGYWDNFDEDPAFSALMMKGYVWNRSWWGTWPNGYDVLNLSFQDFKDSDGDGDNEIDLEVNTFEAKHFELNRYYFRPNTQGVFVRSYVQQPAPSTRKAWRGGGTPYTGPTTPVPTGPYAAAGGKWVYYYDINSNGIVDAGEQVFPVYDASNNPVLIYNPTPQWSWNLESIPAPGTYTYWQPEAPFNGCWIFAKGNADDTSPGWTMGASMYPNGFKTLVTDGHGTTPYPSPQPYPLWMDGDTSEIRLGKIAFFYTQFNYPPDTGGLVTPVISMIGSDNGVNPANYYAWINGTLGNNTATWADWPRAYPNGPIFKFVSNNQSLGADWSDFDRGQHYIGSSDWPYAGAVTKINTLWDDIRCIPQSGYLVSVPFNTGLAPIRWGTVSWTRQTPPLAQTNIDMYTRKTTTTFPTTDSGWTVAATNGAAVGGTEPWMQYKAVLTSSAINRTVYSQSSRTPVMEDVTITYMPVAQIKYWREGP